METEPGRCPECAGLLLWGDRGGWVPHTQGWHAVRHRLLLRAAWRLMREELVLRRLALDEALSGRVLVLWRVVMPTEVRYMYTQQITHHAWDTLDHGRLLAMLADDLCDSIQSQCGIRPHRVMVKHRVLDPRTHGFEDAGSKAA